MDGAVCDKLVWVWMKVFSSRDALTQNERVQMSLLWGTGRWRGKDTRGLGVPAWLLSHGEKQREITEGSTTGRDVIRWNSFPNSGQHSFVFPSCSMYSIWILSPPPFQVLSLFSTFQTPHISPVFVCSWYSTFLGALPPFYKQSWLCALYFRICPLKFWTC